MVHAGRIGHGPGRDSRIPDLEQQVLGGVQQRDGRLLTSV
jgi:hypothetical protein